jgi:hypothetical protein
MTPTLTYLKLPTLYASLSVNSKQKGPSKSRKSLMEELAGTAPASAGLSWLVVYRHSLFCCLREQVFKP